MTTLILLLALSSQASGNHAAEGVTRLEHYRWHNRLLLIFAPDEQDAHYLEQQEVFAEVDKSELGERDLLTFTTFATSGFAQQYTPKATRALFSAAQADRLRRELEVREADFCVILTGKDGGEKRRSDVPAQALSLFEQIDSMPMRRREMSD